jgi:hypothetical protein
MKSRRPPHQRPAEHTTRSTDMIITVTRYRSSRYFAVYVDGELLAVTVYKKGAEAIRARLLASA